MLKLEYQYETQNYEYQDVVLHLTTVSNFESIVDQTVEQLQKHGVPDLAPEHYPYFAVLWPSARVLTDSLLVGPIPFSVLEIGCGLGLPSLALASKGVEVTAVDHHQDVGIFLAKNAQRNGIATDHLKFLNLSWQSLPPAIKGQRFARIIASDIIYESELVPQVAQVLQDLAHDNLERGGQLWITDPGRPHLQNFVSEMEARGFRVAVTVQNEIFVLRLKRVE